MTTPIKKQTTVALFARKRKPYNVIPPSKAVLIVCIKRDVLQAGHTLGQSLNRMMELPPPDRCDWQWQDNVWVRYWTSLPQIVASCQDL